MLPDVYTVRKMSESFLAIMPRPRSGDWLDDEISGLRDLGITDLVSLLEWHEELDLGLEGERAAAEAAGIRFWSFPVPDRSVPSDLAAFRTLVTALASRLEQGRSVAVHCRAGIGRSGILTAAILVNLGEEASRVFEVISEARGLEVPDTPEQVAWFERTSHEFGRDA